MLTWMIALFIVCDATLCASCSIRLLVIAMRWWWCRFLLRRRCAVAMMWWLQRRHIIHIAVALAIYNIVAVTAIATVRGMLLLQIVVSVITAACIRDTTDVERGVWVCSPVQRFNARPHAHIQWYQRKWQFTIPVQRKAKRDKRIQLEIGHNCISRHLFNASLV